MIFSIIHTSSSGKPNPPQFPIVLDHIPILYSQMQMVQRSKIAFHVENTVNYLTLYCVCALREVATPWCTGVTSGGSFTHPIVGVSSGVYRAVH